MEAQIPRDTMDEKKSGGRRGRMAFGFVEEQEWKNSSSLLYARCANRKFKTYERRTSSLQTIGQRRQPLSLARQKKKKRLAERCLPYINHFSPFGLQYPSLSLFSHSSLSLSARCKHTLYLQKDLWSTQSHSIQTAYRISPGSSSSSSSSSIRFSIELNIFIWILETWFAFT